MSASPFVCVCVCLCVVWSGASCFVGCRNSPRATTDALMLLLWNMNCSKCCYQQGPQTQSPGEDCALMPGLPSLLVCLAMCAEGYTNLSLELAPQCASVSRITITGKTMRACFCPADSRTCLCSSCFECHLGLVQTHCYLHDASETVSWVDRLSVRDEDTTLCCIRSLVFATSVLCSHPCTAEQ